MVIVHYFSVHYLNEIYIIFSFLFPFHVQLFIENCVCAAEESFMGLSTHEQDHFNQIIAALHLHECQKISILSAESTETNV